jgi:hypothetical protein
MNDQEKPPSSVLHEMLGAAWVSRMIYAAAKLGIADLVADAPRSCDELAAATETHAPTLYRLLNAPASVGIFTEVAPRRFGLTPLAEGLRAGVPDSLRPLAIMWGADWAWRSWGEILYSLKTGQSAFEHVYGMGVFDYLTRHPEDARVCDETMVALSTQTATEVASVYDFPGIDTLVDVGGGHGTLLAAILKANPLMRGILFDLPHVVEGSQEPLEATGVADRCEGVGGSFFEKVPEGDACILKWIIHDWDDERSLAILRNCRRALPSDGKLLLVENVIRPGNDPDPAKQLDLCMLVWTSGGRERDESEYRALYEASGFRLTRIVPTPSGMSVIEGAPA